MTAIRASESDAESRVDDAFARARQTAETARKAVAHTTGAVMGFDATELTKVVSLHQKSYRLLQWVGGALRVLAELCQ